MDLKTPTELWSKLREEFAIKCPEHGPMSAREERDKLRLSDDGDFDILRSSSLVISERMLFILVKPHSPKWIAYAPKSPKLTNDVSASSGVFRDLP